MLLPLRAGKAGTVQSRTWRRQGTSSFLSALARPVASLLYPHWLCYGSRLAGGGFERREEGARAPGARPRTLPATSLLAHAAARDGTALAVCDSLAYWYLRMMHERPTSWPAPRGMIVTRLSSDSSSRRAASSLCSSCCSRRFCAYAVIVRRSRYLQWKARVCTGRVGPPTLGLRASRRDALGCDGARVSSWKTLCSYALV